MKNRNFLEKKTKEKVTAPWQVRRLLAARGVRPAANPVLHGTFVSASSCSGAAWHTFSAEDEGREREGVYSH